LLARDLVVQLNEGMACIDDGHDRLELDTLANVRIGEKRLKHRRRVRQTRRFDDEPLEAIAEPRQ
jgi:hypothetical protein